MRPIRRSPRPVALIPDVSFQAVIELLEAWRPDVVVFDNAGRTAQLRRRAGRGPRIVYVSARPRQRARRFAGTGCG